MAPKSIYKPIIQKIESDLFEAQGLSVAVLRLDLLHPEIGGNKWFKLKINLENAIQNNLRTIVTFGGAFSNHIAATAATCKMAGIKSIGIIRGEKVTPLNDTLSLAEKNGMFLHFVDRKTYDEKTSEQFESELRSLFGRHLLIPEGGANKEGVMGCTEILKPQLDHDYVLCACGTGTTYAGLLVSTQPTQKVIGISVLKGENKLPAEITLLNEKIFQNKDIIIGGNEEFEKTTIEYSCISNRYCFGGYAKYDAALVAFKNEFEKKYNIPLDHVYTVKLFYALFDLARQTKFKTGSRILLIHSGGLQGNAGFETRFGL